MPSVKIELASTPGTPVFAKLVVSLLAKSVWATAVNIALRMDSERLARPRGRNKRSGGNLTLQMFA